MSTATAIEQEERPRRFVALELRALEQAGFFRAGEAVDLDRGVIVCDGARRRFTAEEFERMADLGFFDEEDDVELIDGEVYSMARPRAPHGAVISRLNRILLPRLLGRAAVRVQVPIHLGPEDEPQPDVALVEPRDDDYARAHPRVADLFLVVEVMDASIWKDRAKKLPQYARAGVPELWLVDIPGDVIEVCRAPAGGIYTDRRILPRGPSLAPSAFPDVVLTIDEILGPKMPS